LKVQSIEKDGQIIAQIFDLRELTESVFPTPPQLPMQFGASVLNVDWTSKAHIHKSVSRHIIGTPEFIFLMKGSLEATLFSDDHSVMGTFVLTSNMALLQFSGGHELKFRKGTSYFEIKQGPYLGRDTDKYDL